MIFFSKHKTIFFIFRLYNNGWRDANSLRSWAFQFLPSKVTELDDKKFSTNVLRDSKPWVVDFYGIVYNIKRPD